MATLAFASRPISRQSSTKRAQTLRMARPLSLRKSATVLWSGTRRPRSHITSTLRPASRSSRWLDPFEPEFGKIERIYERGDHPHWILLVDPVLKAFRQQ